MENVELIKKKTKIGMVWNAFEKIAVQGISFIISIILARLLSPSDYGVVGLLTVFLSLSNVFIDSGFSKGLIQKKDRQEIDYSTTFIFNIVVSIILYVGLFLLAPGIAKFYDNPELISLARVLFIVIILNSFTVVQSAKLQLEVNFKKIAFINLIASLLSGLFGILAAYRGLGVWALIVQYVSRYVLLVFLYWIVGRWFPKTFFSVYSFRKLFSYGSKLLLTGLISQLISNVHNLLIGKFFSPESLGYYSRAEQYPSLINSTASSVLQTSTFPMLASLQSEKEELKIVFRKLIKLSCLFFFPCMIGLAMVSKTMVIVLLTEKWLIAADYLFWIALSFWGVPLQILNINLLNAIGRTDLTLKLDFIKAPIIILSIASTFPFGMTYVVVGKFLFSFIYLIIDCYYTKKFLNFGVLSQLLDSWKIIVASVIMALFLYFLNSVFRDENIVKLLLQIIFGVFIYIVFLILLREDELHIFLNKVKFKLNWRK